MLSISHVSSTNSLVYAGEHRESRDASLLVKCLVDGRELLQRKSVGNKGGGVELAGADVVVHQHLPILLDWGLATTDQADDLHHRSNVEVVDQSNVVCDPSKLLSRDHSLNQKVQKRRKPHLLDTLDLFIDVLACVSLKGESSLHLVEEAFGVSEPSGINRLVKTSGLKAPDGLSCLKSMTSSTKPVCF